MVEPPLKKVRTEPPGDNIGEFISAKALTGKRALVTGARKGIGRGVALCLSRAGCAAVCIVDTIDDDATREVVRLITANGSAGSVIVADMSSIKSIRSAIDDFAADGGIDILINNAIIPHSPPASSQSARLLDVTEGMWEGLVSVGFKGYFFACQHAAKHMIKQKRGGSLICMSSVHATNPTADWTVYGSCKAGLERMVRGLAADLAGTGIQANCIAPGFIANALPTSSNLNAIDGPVDPTWGLTMDGDGVAVGDETLDSAARRGTDFQSIVPAGSLGAPSDIGAAVLFLCSAMGRYVNGQTMRVDGGMSAVSYFV